MRYFTKIALKTSVFKAIAVLYCHAFSLMKPKASRGLFSAAEKRGSGLLTFEKRGRKCLI
jgi:hypothetical protein